MKRILVYSHDTYGLGNIRRMLAISEHMCAVHDDVSVLLVSGSPMLHAFRVSPRLDYIKLPCLTRTGDGNYEVKTLDMSYRATIGMRSELLVAAVEAFAPDVVLIDKKPFGVDEELKPALAAARAGPRPPKLVLLLRDILDSPDETIRIWRKNRYYDAIESYFESVLVLGSADVYDVTRWYDFPAAAADKVEFCGYVRRPASNRSRDEVRSALGIAPLDRMVLLTPGGGEDGGRLTEQYLAGLATLAAPRATTVIVSGPEMPIETQQRLRRAADGCEAVRVLEFSDDMMGLIQAADLVVSMAGYNTVCEILSAARRAIVVPRVHPVEEQLIRANVLSSLGMLRSIHPDQVTPARMMAEATLALELAAVEQQHPLADVIDMGGLDRVEKHLSGLLGDA